MVAEQEKYISAKEERCLRLLQELENGEIPKDTLPNSSYNFSGGVIADYSSRTDIFMNSNLADMIMKNHVGCPEYFLWKELYG